MLNARPRDLAGLRDTLAALPALRAALADLEARPIRDAFDALAVDAAWQALLVRAIAAEPSANVRDGGVIAAGFDSELDELRSIDTDCGAFLVDLERRERERSGIASLKVEYNRVHGFYIEVTHAHVERVPADYRRRQTLKNAERYITPELKAFEDKALSAQERALAREKRLFEQLLADLAPAVAELQRAAEALATLDVFAALAERATTLKLARPRFVREPGIAIRARPASGRRASGRAFHPERRAARSRTAAARRHRTEHGRQVDVHAADGGDRAAGLLRRVRSGR